jgi:tetratricopeptide (TPR) repeat protein
MTLQPDPSLMRSPHSSLQSPAAAFPLQSTAMAYLLATIAAVALIGPGGLDAQVSYVQVPQVQVPQQAILADWSPTDRALAGNAPAYHALMEGRVDEAQTRLIATLAQNPADAMAHQLLCRVYYAQDQADAAIHQCELAAAADPRNSDDQLWLGRAYGMKARHAGPIAAFILARKVRDSFEAAARLNPSNVAALSDLGEYYVAAPSIVGGGADKAQALASRMMPQFPSAAHRMLAWLAESNKDIATAETEFKLAVSSHGSSDAHSSADADRSPAEAWIDLGHFYQSHSRPDDALAAIKSGLAADRTHGPVLVDAASILTSAHRNPDLAERCLHDYLASHSKSDAAPAFKVHLQLSRLLTARGDANDASKEVASATALAPTFTRTTRHAQGS